MNCIINGKYSPHKAQKLYSKRKNNFGANKKLSNSNLLIDIQNKLKEGWTPEQVSRRAKKDGSYTISFKSIYLAIKNGLLLETPIIMRKQEELSQIRRRLKRDLKEQMKEVKSVILKVIRLFVMRNKAQSLPVCVGN